jgi:hypothetical protein
MLIDTDMIYSSCGPGLSLQALVAYPGGIGQEQPYLRLLYNDREELVTKSPARRRKGGIRCT